MLQTVLHAATCQISSCQFVGQWSLALLAEHNDVHIVIGELPPAWPVDGAYCYNLACVTPVRHGVLGQGDGAADDLRGATCAATAVRPLDLHSIRTGSRTCSSLKY